MQAKSDLVTGALVLLTIVGGVWLGTRPAPAIDNPYYFQPGPVADAGTYTPSLDCGRKLESMSADELEKYIGNWTDYEIVPMDTTIDGREYVVSVGFRPDGKACLLSAVVGQGNPGSPATADIVPPEAE
jgi:hypothetical protein